MAERRQPDWLTDDFTQKIYECVGDLPANTPLRDLWDWRETPLLVPEWTALMLEITTRQRLELRTILGYALRSSDIGEPYTLGEFVSTFNASKLRAGGMGPKRITAYTKAFRGESPTYEDLTGKTQLSPEEQKQEAAKRKRPGKNIEYELWEYAHKNGLIEKIINSKRVSADEISILRLYFQGELPSGAANTSLFFVMERFTQAVAYFV